MKRTETPQAELHTHLGAAVDPAVLWSIAHRQGIKLPSKDYWDFYEMVTMTGDRRNHDLDEMHNSFFHWTELIQSSPDAIEEAVKGVIGGGYRQCNLVLQELRFNPMKRNRGGERDLDHIIQSAIWGMERAVLEYPQVQAGIILMMDRSLTFEQNEIILSKAIKYRDSGIIGIDIAGPERSSFSMREHAVLFRRAKDAGLGVTLHTGEAGSMAELEFVVHEIRPHRIGHGIMCAHNPRLMDEIVRQGIVLETCPTSNIKNSVVKDLDELRKIYQTLIGHEVKFCINTDGPEMYRQNLIGEQRMLLESGILTAVQVDQCSRWAFEATFLKR